jgi:hypothetical protein
MATIRKGIMGTMVFIMASCMTMQPQQLSNNGVTGQKEVQPEKVILFDNTKLQPDHWYACMPGKPVLDLEKKKLKVSFTAAMGDCFGMWFEAADVTKNPVIKLKANYVAKGTAKNTDLLVCFTDNQKNMTYLPLKKTNLIDGKGFVEYFIDYNNEIKQKDIKFDFTKVISILFFINITGNKDNTGDLLIEEISLSKLAK